MRPMGVSAIAALMWVRGALYALGALALLGIGHLSARLISAVASDSFLEGLVSLLGKALASPHWCSRWFTLWWVSVSGH